MMENSSVNNKKKKQKIANMSPIFHIGTLRNEFKCSEIHKKAIK